MAEMACPICHGSGTYLADIGPTGRIIRCDWCKTIPPEKPQPSDINTTPTTDMKVTIQPNEGD